MVDQRDVVGLLEGAAYVHRPCLGIEHRIYQQQVPLSGDAHLQVIAQTEALQYAQPISLALSLLQIGVCQAGQPRGQAVKGD